MFLIQDCLVGREDVGARTKVARFGVEYVGLAVERSEREFLSIGGEHPANRVNVRRISRVDASRIHMRFLQRLLDRFVWPLRFNDEKRKPASPDRVIGNIPGSLARPFVDLGGLHILLGTDPLVWDIQKAGMN